MLQSSLQMCCRACSCSISPCITYANSFILTHVLSHLPSHWVISMFSITTQEYYTLKTPFHTSNEIFSNAVLYGTVWNMDNHRALHHTLCNGKLILRLCLFSEQRWRLRGWNLVGQWFLMFEVKLCDVNYLWCWLTMTKRWRILIYILCSMNEVS
jgi:hypothetical protein